MNTPRKINTTYEGDRVHLTVYLDEPRYRRLLATADGYAEHIGRPVSLSLLICRSLDLLHEHLEALDGAGPGAAVTERLAILGPARHPLHKE